MSEKKQEEKLYRIVSMIPTEIYISADSTEEAYESIDWLFRQYPAVDAPIASESDTRSPMMPRILTIEYV